MSPIAAKDRWTVILIVVVILMGIEILYLMYQNHQLKSLIQDPKKYFKTLKPEETVPAFTAYDADGNDVSIRYSPEAPRTLLFWFAPGCESCEGNIDFWNEIYDKYKDSPSMRYLGLCAGTPDEAREFIDTYRIQFPVICVTDKFIVEAYEGHVLPQTVLISPEGKIIKVWPGALEKNKEDEILSYLAESKSLTDSQKEVSN
jgi:peroxiredoxin